jgi:hypothetical protein
VHRSVAEEVSGFLRRRLGAQVRLRQAAAETRSEAALDLVLRGEQAYADALALHQSQDTADVASAVRMLGDADALLARAEEADPRWTRPTVGRGWVALRAAGWGQGQARAAAFDSAVARAERVLARERANPQALEIRGTALWNRSFEGGADGAALVDAAERDLRAALAAEPALASAWGTLSLLLYIRGRLAESAQAAQRALEQDAWLEGAGQLLTFRFYALLTTGDYRGAGEACDEGHRAFPHDWRFVECRLTLLRYDTSRSPDTALAWRVVAQLDSLDPAATAAAAGRGYSPIFRRMVAAAVSARAGDADRARAELARARVNAAADYELRVSLAYDEAVLLRLLGDRQGARERLEVFLAQFPSERAAKARDPLVHGLLTPAGAP